MCAAQFGIDPAGFGNISDQPVNPLDIVRGDCGQFGTQLIVFDFAERFKRAAQAGERVLDFVRDIGGESLNRACPNAATRSGCWRARSQT